jgi:hypothetical protein
MLQLDKTSQTELQQLIQPFGVSKANIIRRLLMQATLADFPTYWQLKAEEYRGRLTACDHDRIPRARLYQHQEYRGYIAGKTRYFYELKLHLMGTKDGQPVECFLTPGSFSDVRALKTFQFDVPNGSYVYADKAYNDYALEDVLVEAADIHLSPIREKNSTRPVPPYITYLQRYHRKMIETVGSLIERMLPKTIHAVTAEGFESKVFLFVLAHSFNYL